MVLKAQTKLPSEANPTGYYIFIWAFWSEHLFWNKLFWIPAKKNSGEKVNKK